MEEKREPKDSIGGAHSGSNHAISMDEVIEHARELRRLAAERDKDKPKFDPPKGRARRFGR